MLLVTRLSHRPAYYLLLMPVTDVTLACENGSRSSDKWAIKSPIARFVAWMIELEMAGPAAALNPGIGALFYSIPQSSWDCGML